MTPQTSRLTGYIWLLVVLGRATCVSRDDSENSAPPSQWWRQTRCNTTLPTGAARQRNSSYTSLNSNNNNTRVHRSTIHCFFSIDGDDAALLRTCKCTLHKGLQADEQKRHAHSMHNTHSQTYSAIFTQSRQSEGHSCSVMSSLLATF
ncbi:hypothetical protein NP493_401g00001 [Ridgeia piscesae]|uniref:Secreted protein n=1 Tax=Ridgeia piscesae TaxID=27915 RepID=A0AAD9NUP4_RIDPI|nr:hypothetical protein NP493_401g00001 [Ridgeia piscesae]